MIKVSLSAVAVGFGACILVAFIFSWFRPRPKLVTMDDLKEANCVVVENVRPELQEPYSQDPKDVDAAKALIIESRGKSKERVNLEAGYGVIRLRHMSKLTRDVVGAYYFPWSNTDPQPESPITKLIESIRAKKETVDTVSMRAEGATEKEIAQFKKENGLD